MRISGRSSLAILLTFLFLLPLQVAALAYAASIYGDNVNYKAFHDAAAVSGGIAKGYVVFVANIGSIEPLYFLTQWLAAVSGVPYIGYVALKNFGYCVAVSAFVSTRFGMTVRGCLVVLYFSFDFYSFRIMSELHRLGFAAIFVIALAAYWRKFLLIGAMATLSHLQIFLLAPTAFTIVRHKFVLFGGAALAALAFSGQIISKLTYYFNVDFPSLIKSGVVVAVMLLAMLVQNRRVYKVDVMAGVSLLFFSSMLGSDRILIMIVSYYILRLVYLSKDIRIFSWRIIPTGVLVALMCLYNLAKIYIEYMSAAAGR